MTDIDERFIAIVGDLALGQRPAQINTWDLAQKCLDEGVQGDFVEAGVFAGVHPAIMAKVLMVNGAGGRRVHLFDSFAGIPKCSTNEGKHEQGKYGKAGPEMESSGHCICDVPAVKKYMKGWGIDSRLLVYHEGWFQTTMKRAVNWRTDHRECLEQIALLRIDCDLYDSTTEVMNWLYPLVSYGGYVISDDFGSPYCQKPVFTKLSELGETITLIKVHHSNGTHWWQRVPV